MVRAADQGKAYYSAFERAVAGRRECDESFAAWGRIGTNIMGVIGDAEQKIITPACRAAEEKKDAAELARWHDASKVLDTKVVQQFMRLRVRAVYMMATGREVQAKEYQQELESMRSGVAAFTDFVRQRPELREAAATVAKASIIGAAGESSARTGAQQSAVEMASAHATRAEHEPMSDVLSHEAQAVSGNSQRLSLLSPRRHGSGRRVERVVTRSISAR